jgi:hypothetical protein
MSWNLAPEQMFGYGAAEAVGQSIRLIIRPIVGTRKTMFSAKSGLGKGRR